MSEITSPILFEAAVSYANETSDASIRGDLRIAFVAGAEWQWKRVSDEEAVARLEAENARLRTLLQPFADIAETEDDVGRCDPEDDRILVVQAHGCQLAEMNVGHFEEIRAALELSHA